MSKINEAKNILKLIGMPVPQQNDLCGYTLLALLGLKEDSSWYEVSNDFIRIHDIIVFTEENYGIHYAENSRETFRKSALQNFKIAALIEDNAQPTNSPNYRYKVTKEALDLLKAYGTNKWEKKIKKYLKRNESLISKYENKRAMTKIPVQINGTNFTFSTGSHNKLQKAIIEEFAPRFAPNAIVLYVGDTKDKSLYKDYTKLSELGIEIGDHDKLPDVVLYSKEKGWIYFIEAVTSVGPISSKRLIEFEQMSENCHSGKVFVTAFLDMKTFKKFADSLAWETEAWLSEMPDHMIHLNGDKFLGPRN